MRKTITFSPLHQLGLAGGNPSPIGARGLVVWKDQGNGTVPDDQAADEKGQGVLRALPPKAQPRSDGEPTMAATRRSGVADKKTQRLNLQVGVDAVERLLIHCIKSKKSPGELVTELIEKHLREWKVQSNTASRSAPVMSQESVESDDQASESDSKAA